MARSYGNEEVHPGYADDDVLLVSLLGGELNQWATVAVLQFRD